MEIRGYCLVDAVKHLTGDEPQKEVTTQHVPKEKVVKAPFQLPKPMVCSLALIPYLQKRGISDEVILRCLQENILYESRFNGKPVCVFVGKDSPPRHVYEKCQTLSGKLSWSHYCELLPILKKEALW